MSQADIDAFAGKVKGKQASELGPALLDVNRLAMPDMLEGFKKLTGPERDEFRKAAFDGIPAQGCARSSTLSQARQVGIERIRYAFDVVTTGKLPAKIPGDLYETGQFKDACAYLKTFPARNVWITIIGGVCEDAQLRKQGDDGVVMGGDQVYGQAGWHIGIKYGDAQFGNLPGLIAKRCSGFLLDKVGINAHGDPGEVAVNGVDANGKPFSPFLARDNVSSFDGVWTFLDRVMIDAGSLLFHSCLAGNGQQGTDLLVNLAKKLPARKVVGFSKLGFTSVNQQRRKGDVCVEPGVRDTEYPVDPTPDNIRFGTGRVTEYDKYFKNGEFYDLKALPWQSETSPHAKVAKDGVIIRGANL